MRAVKIVLMFAVTLWGFGCASNVHQDVIQPVNLPTGKVQNVYLMISGPSSVTSDPAYLQSAEELRNVIDEKLRATIPAARLESAGVPPPSGVKANLVIEDFRYVSGAARFLTGIMSGTARLRVRAELTDLHSGQKIGESTFGTSSSTSEGIMGGTTSRQIEAVADSVVKMLSNNSK
jgi:hypothetical protein